MSGAFAELVREWLHGPFPELEIELAAAQHLREPELAACVMRLRQARVGLLCVTPDAIAQPWLYFALGLMKRHLGPSGLIVPIFLDVIPSDVSPTPLHVFQAVQVNLQEFLQLGLQIEAHLALPGDSADRAQRFSESWPSFEERARLIPGPASKAFVVSVLLPHGSHWFRLDPSGHDGDWREFMQVLLPNLAAGPFGMQDIPAGEYECLDVTGERWVRAPAVLSRVNTSHLALVHPQVVDSNGGSARLAAHAVRASFNPNDAGLKVFHGGHRIMVATNVT